MTSRYLQGDTKGSPFWRFVTSVIHDPTKEQKACHAPKPILLDTGGMTFPYAWQPAIVPISLATVGNLVIACVPGELTSMAGRRLRSMLTAELRCAPC